MKNIKKSKNYITFYIFDLLSLIISFLLSFVIRNGFLKFYIIPIYSYVFVYSFIIFGLISLFTNPYKDIYKRGYLVELEKAFINIVIHFVFVIVFLFITKSSNYYSRTILFLTYFLYFIFSYIFRIIIKKSFRNYFKNTANNEQIAKKSLFIICKYEDFRNIIKDLKDDNIDLYYINAVSFIDEDKKEYEGIKIINKEDILSYVSTNWIDEIYISCDYNLLSKDLIERLNITGIPISIKKETMSIFNDRVQDLNHIGKEEIITFSIKKLSKGEVIIKRIIDICGGIVGCLITLILIIIIGPIIYLKSPGKIIYTSKRVGKNGKVFNFYKFRSMIINADELKEKLMEQNQYKSDLLFKIENDPRIIPGIGNFIRKTSLDEFPQFFNVLKGYMSLVGTRPPTLEEYQKYNEYYRYRLSIKPGITGMWQVSGRSNITNFDEVVKLDTEYIKNQSLSLDIKILFKTIMVLFKKEGSM